MPHLILYEQQPEPLAAVPDTFEDIPRDLRLDEQLAIEEAIRVSDGDEWKIDKIFFRRFTDARGSQVAAYVIDNTADRYAKETLGKLQQKLWWQARAPLVYLYQPNKIDILSCARGPDFWQNGQVVYHPSDHFKTAAAIDRSEAEQRERFRYAHLADGTFWEAAENQKLADADKAAHKSLLDSVIEADKRLKGEQHPTKRRLLLLFVLIKYLEDRGVFEQERGFFSQFYPEADSFLEVLRSKRP